MTGATASTKSSHLVIPAIIGVAVGVLAVAVVFIVRQPDSVIVLADSDAETVHVWIEGDVTRPGLYQMEESSTVSDVIRLAGAQSTAVDVGSLDLDQVVSNGLQIRVASSVASPVEGAEDQNQPPAAPGQLININVADVATLDLLPGIGPALGSRIVEYRQQHGAFSSVDELAEVRGISPRMVDEMRNLITVGN